MNPTSLIVARFLAVHGVPDMADMPNTDAITAFCWSEFNQVPSEHLAIKVRAALLALAKERR